MARPAAVHVASKPEDRCGRVPRHSEWQEVVYGLQNDARLYLNVGRQGESSRLTPACQTVLEDTLNAGTNDVSSST